MTQPMTATELATVNRLRPAARRADEVAGTAAVVGIWLLLPFAIGALVFIFLGLVILAASDAPEPSMPVAAWLVITVLLQTLYWVWMADVAGRHPLQGLWALIPLVALIPTFSLARSVALRSGAAYPGEGAGAP